MQGKIVKFVIQFEYNSGTLAKPEPVWIDRGDRKLLDEAKRAMHLYSSDGANDKFRTGKWRVIRRVIETSEAVECEIVAA